MKNYLAAIIVPIVVAIFSFSAHAYDLDITNNTQFTASGEVNYSGCKNDKYSVAPGAKWSTGGRGGCLITWISATLSGAPKTPGAKAGSVTRYDSSGTSYAHFFIQGTEKGYGVYSKQSLAAENAKTREGKSPGFYITNKTSWPVSIALEQVGCLYYGTFKPGEVFDRDTGAVWFTIKANISADGKEPRKDWDCVKPVAIIVGSILASAATAGVATWAALPAGAAAVGFGGASVAAGATTATALSGIATSTAVIVGTAAVTGGAAGGGAGVAVLKMTAEEIGKALEPNSAGELKGQYAGPDWPFRCDQKPTYEITGGWGKPGVDAKGNYFVDPGTPLKVTKKNTCGNKMM